MFATSPFQPKIIRAETVLCIINYWYFLYWFVRWRVNVVVRPYPPYCYTLCTMDITHLIYKMTDIRKKLNETVMMMEDTQDSL